jgi:starch-binding outer membrane protein SusE/F
MKNIFKTIIFSCLLISISSCENDKDPIVSANGFELRKDPTIASPTTLLEVDNSVIFGNYNWDSSNNGVASVSTYKLVIFDHDSDTQLLYPVEYVGQGLETPDNKKATITVKEMNDMLNNLKSFKCGEMNIDLRIQSTLGTNPKAAYIQYSNPINYKITGYSKSTPILSFVKDGNTPSNEPKLLSTGFISNSDYEGYVYLIAGSYKFVRPDPCGSYASPTILGGIGSLASGTIDTGATPASIVIANTGHYLIKVNLVTNTYSIKEFRTFGVFGKATRINGTANAVPMTDNNDNIWKLTVDLIKGKSFRFKSNLWTGVTTTPDLINIGTPEIPNLIQFPPYIPPTGTTLISTLGKSLIDGQVVEVTGDNGEFTVPGTFVDNYTRQKYLIELNVSNPRKYTYTLTAK